MKPERECRYSLYALMLGLKMTNDALEHFSTERPLYDNPGIIHSTHYL